VSRVGLTELLGRRMALPDPARIQRHLARPDGERVHAVLVGHTHFDHALDVPALVRRYRCPAYGSASLQRLLGLHGLAADAVVVESHRDYELGPFTVRFVPSVHSKLLFGLKVPMDGEFTCDHLDGLSAGAYRCGAVYGIRIEVAGTVLYHQGSANLLDDEVPGGGVDIFLAGVAGRSFTPRYWERILRRLEPRVIVPTHYDDFFRPLGSEMGLSTNVQVARVPDEIARVSGEFQVAALPLGPR
jgi:L-ascorbate metabolism protein UlaG (beta-lactamase superfamily)